MTGSIDDLTYGDKTAHTHDEVKQGNPGRPQSDFEEPKDDAEQDKVVLDPELQAPGLADETNTQAPE